MRQTFITRIIFSLLTWTLAIVSTSGNAQETYPSKPVVIVVPQTAGGTNDFVGRVVAQKLGEVMNASFVVENRPGAGGNIGTQAVGNAAKDGYTLLMTISSSQAINPALYKNPGFDPIKDFAPIALIGSVPNVLVVHPSFPAKTLDEFLKLVKSKPANTYQYGSAGNGTLNHLLGEMLNQMAKVELQHIPYKGVSQAINDLLGGQVPMAFTSLPSVIQHLKAGKLIALGVSSPKRSNVLPDVPAIGEKVPGYSGTLWVGLFAPAGTPKPILSKLEQGMRKTLALPDLKEKLQSSGMELATATPTELTKLMKDDIARWAKIVKTSGASLD